MHISQKTVDQFFHITDKNRKLFGVFLKQLLLFNKVKLISSQYKFLELNEKELVLRNIVQFIHIIYTPHRINFEHLSSFIHNSINFSRIDLFSILCPSYKNNGTPGIKETIGDTTKGALSNSIFLFQTLEKMSKGYYEIYLDLYYGDCGLEQRNTQKKSEREIQISNNLIQINTELEKHKVQFQCIRLSQIRKIRERIGFEGAQNTSILKLFPNLNHKIIKRNHLFYCNILKRDENQSKKRSEHSICNYAIMGNYFTEHYKNPLMLYTANIYEKGVAYNFLNHKKYLMIIYPKKYLGSIQSLHELSQEIFI